MFLMHFITVQKMSEKDRYCCLLFDEMSIRETFCNVNICTTLYIHALEIICNEINKRVCMVLIANMRRSLFVITIRVALKE
jgi:hypothetical protein